jgi:hypothetical protein
MTTTRTIAGHRITLTVGKRYVASRPIASSRRTVFPVHLNESEPGQPWKRRKTVGGRMSYDSANKFIKAFNNGPTSFQGRIWK